jgi:hypothetical protein
LGNALYGMQGMCSDSAEVRTMLLVLIPKVEDCKNRFHSQDVGNSLYGMQAMSSDCAEVRAMLLALVPKVESCRGALNAHAIGYGLYGMQGMTAENEYIFLLDFLYDNAMSITGKVSLCNLQSCEDLIHLGQHLALTLPKFTSSVEV